MSPVARSRPGWRLAATRGAWPVALLVGAALLRATSDGPVVRDSVGWRRAEAVAAEARLDVDAAVEAWDRVAERDTLYDRERVRAQIRAARLLAGTGRCREALERWTAMVRRYGRDGGVALSAVDGVLDCTGPWPDGAGARPVLSAFSVDAGVDPTDLVFAALGGGPLLGELEVACRVADAWFAGSEDAASDALRMAERTNPRSGLGSLAILVAIAAPRLSDDPPARAQVRRRLHAAISGPEGLAPALPGARGADVTCDALAAALGGQACGVDLRKALGCSG